jgi:hypothetical protein
MLFKTQRASASSAAVAVTVAPGVPWALHEIRFVNASGSLAATSLTATMDAGAGAKHDAVVYANSMSASSNLRATFTPPLLFTHYSDELDVAYANGSNAAYGISIVYKPIV